MVVIDSMANYVEVKKAFLLILKCYHFIMFWIFKWLHFCVDSSFRVDISQMFVRYS